MVVKQFLFMRFHVLPILSMLYTINSSRIRCIEVAGRFELAVVKLSVSFILVVLTIAHWIH